MALPRVDPLFGRKSRIQLGEQISQVTGQLAGFCQRDKGKLGHGGIIAWLWGSKGSCG
jgi:hypothetical protein